MILFALYRSRRLCVLSGWAKPFGSLKRRVSQLKDSYDFIVAGGGTSGLTVADRLAKLFPHSRHPRTSSFSTFPPPLPRRSSWLVWLEALGGDSPRREK